jgi:DNA uptake protein ComE-like DNA-binding protein
MERKYDSQFTIHDSRKRSGSALILTVVLTTLLAIIAVVFLLASRIDKTAASAASENRELSFAIETTLEKISRELVFDVPGVASQEYHDYPGPEDGWLASLEPNDKQMWQQISDVTGYLNYRRWPARNVLITNSAPTPPLLRAVIADYQPIALDPNGLLLEQLADADGDGIGDSKWIILPDVTSTKGRPIYVAIRITCNGGMLNANTAYEFDPNGPRGVIDGSSQLQINLMALAGRIGNPPTPAEEKALLLARANYGSGVDPCNLGEYERSVTWYYGSSNDPYTPFDISDELELRYRFLLNHTAIDARLEQWGGEFRKSTISTPVTSGGKPLNDWFKRAYSGAVVDPNYAYRHITTTCSIDRLITAAALGSLGGAPRRKMVNVNIEPVDLLYSAIYRGLVDANFTGTAASQVAAQTAVNLFDYRDNDSIVTSYLNLGDNKTYYGFERPCIYISELADYNSVTPGDPPVIHTTYAIELYKPYSEDDVPRPGRPGACRLVVGGTTIDIGSPAWPPGKSFYVVQKPDPCTPITPDSNAVVKDYPSLVLAANTGVELQVRVTEPNGVPAYITVDSVSVPSWLVSGQGIKSLQRDITKHKCIRRLWDTSSKAPTLGSGNTYVDNSRPELVQARPANKPFTNIGEIGMVFRTGGYNVPIGSTEADLRLDLKNPMFAHIFNYLTVMDPQDPSEMRVRGRININTAPWFVIAQLPWMQPPIAQAVVAYRDTTAKGFQSIAHLMRVPEMGYYTYDSNNLDKFPDLTPRDGDWMQGNFEERDIIFHRISNLITVRSDVFTAYILVRIGPDGPQRRVVAILDRSRVLYPSDRVKILTLHPVPDPR